MGSSYKDSVLIGSINSICSRYFYSCFGKTLCFVDCIFKLSFLIEIVKTYFLNKINSIYLKFVDLCSKPTCRQAGSTGFISLPPYYGSKIWFWYTNNSILGRFSSFKILILLSVYFFNNASSIIIQSSHLKILMPFYKI